MSDRITCAAFERWLDAGAPDEAAAAMGAHAGSCERCARSSAAAAALERELSAPAGSRTSPGAPAGLTDRVMARVASIERARHTWAPAAPELPWWLDALRQPVAALAAVLAGIVMWRYETLFASAGVAGRALAASASPLATWLAHACDWLLPSGGAEPYTAAAVLIAVAAGIVVPTIALGRWAHGAASR